MFGLSIRTLPMGLLGFLTAVVLGLGAFGIAFGIVNVSSVNDSTVDIATNWLPSISKLRAPSNTFARAFASPKGAASVDRRRRHQCGPARSRPALGPRHDSAATMSL